MAETVLKVEGLSKQYRLGQIGLSTLRDDVDGLVSRLFGKNDRIGRERAGGANETFYALKDVSFDIERGSAVALVGRNGAGKSTLLKIISRITAPTEGRVRYKGRVASLLEVSTGFNQHLTGRENIYLNGAIMGLTREQITKRLDEIIAFSEVEQFIDTPVKRYSSGMYVKLGFAVAAHLDPDILICDEVLAVGDTRFQEKCIRKMGDLASEHTVIYVSHNMHTLRQLCTRALYLENGRLTYQGELEGAISRYAGAAAQQEKTVDLDSMKHEGNMGKLARLRRLELPPDAPGEYPMYGEVRFQLGVHAYEQVRGLRLCALISRPGSGTLATSMSQPLFSSAPGADSLLDVSLPLGGLGPGEYDCTLWLCFIDPIGRMVSYDVVPNAFRFSTGQNLEMNSGMLWNEKRHGLFRLPDIALEIKP